MTKVMTFGADMSRARHMYENNLQHSGCDVYGYFDVNELGISRSDAERYGTSILWQMTEVDEVHFVGDVDNSSDYTSLVLSTAEKRSIPTVHKDLEGAIHA